MLTKIDGSIAHMGQLLGQLLIWAVLSSEIAISKVQIIHNAYIIFLKVESKVVLNRVILTKILFFTQAL